MSQIEAAESVKLAATPRAGDFRQVKAVVEVSGDLKLNPDGKEVRKVPMTVTANLGYHERFLPTEKGLLSARYFTEATATMAINGQEVKQTLREDRRLIGMQSIDDETTLYSLQGPLSREELDLIDIPGRLAGVIAALPPSPVEIGATWSVPDLALAQLLCVDAITKNEVQATFKELKDGIALLRLEGTISAAVTGISTEIEVKASVNIDVARQQVTWLAMGLSENRSIGHAQPGFMAISRIRIASQAAAADPHLSNEALAGAPKSAKEAVTELERESVKGGFAFIHDRKWQAMVDRHDVTILRLIDRGDLISQCNISALPPLGEGKQLTLEGFELDIRKSLGNDFGSFVESKQELNENKCAVLRIVATGNVQEVPIEWIYYHVTDASGRRVSLNFTHEAQRIEQFAGADRAIVANLRFLPLPEKTEAEPPKAVPAPATTAKPAPAATPKVSQKPAATGTAKKK